MTMGKIILEKESKKSAEDAKATINNVAQQNKTNTKTAVDPKIVITVEDDPVKMKERKRREKDDYCRVFLCTVLLLSVLGGGLLICLNMNYYCSEILDMEGSYQKKYEILQKSYDNLKTSYSSVRSSLTNLFVTMPAMTKMYNEDGIFVAMNDIENVLMQLNEPDFIDDSDIDKIIKLCNKNK